MKKSFSAFLSLFFLSTCLFTGAFVSAEENTPLNIYNFFKGKGFKPTYQALSIADESSFPHNVIVEVNSQVDFKQQMETEGAEEKDYGENNDSQDLSFVDSLQDDTFTTEYSNIALVFTQEYAKDRLEDFVNLAKEAESKKLPYNLILVFTANDISKLPKQKGIDVVSGSMTFAQSVENQDDICVYVFSENDGSSENLFITGGNKTACPMWMSSALTSAATLCQFNFSLSQRFVFFYRFGFLTGNNLVDVFYQYNIPACGISFMKEQNPFSLVSSLEDMLCQETLENWERHYLYFKVGNNHFYTGEASLVIFYLAFSLVSLFFLCFMFFTSSRKNHQSLRHIFGSLAFLPVVILATTLCFELTELITINIHNLVFSLGLKIVFSLIVSLVIFLIQIEFDFATSLKSTGFVLLLSCAFNMFIFSTIEISLSFLFFEIFLAAALAVFFKNSITSTIALLLLILPLSPYINDLLAHADLGQVRKLSHLSFLQNLLLAIVFYPFELQWSRTLKIYKIFQNKADKNPKVLIKKGAITLAISITIVLTVYITSTIVFVKKNDTINNGKHAQVRVLDTTEDIDVAYSESYFQDLLMRHLIVNSDRKVLRYIISIESDNGAPIYGSNYDYIFQGSNLIYFKLPDNPTDSIEIDFRSDQNKNCTIKVDAYLEDEEGNIILETFTKDISSSTANSI